MRIHVLARTGPCAQLPLLVFFSKGRPEPVGMAGPQKYRRIVQRGRSMPLQTLLHSVCKTLAAARTYTFICARTCPLTKAQQTRIHAHACPRAALSHLLCVWLSRRHAAQPLQRLLRAAPRHGLRCGRLRQPNGPKGGRPGGRIQQVKRPAGPRPWSVCVFGCAVCASRRVVC